jgi:hypothetical protein
MSEIDIRVRLANAINRMEARGISALARRPRAFYLLQDDYDEFLGTVPTWEDHPFHIRGKPTILSCPVFQGVPARKSEGKATRYSTLYSRAGTSIMVLP